MKHVVKKIHFFRATSPQSRPIADSTHTIEKIAFVVTRIELDSGIMGDAYLLAFDYSPRVIAGALKDICDLAIGFPVCDTGRFITENEKASEYFWRDGLNRWDQGQ